MSKHAQQAKQFLRNKKQAAWHDETLWLVREKRDRMAHQVPEWEQLREAAHQLKQYSNSHLDTLLTQFEPTPHATAPSYTGPRMPPSTAR